MTAKFLYFQNKMIQLLLFVLLSTSTFTTNGEMCHLAEDGYIITSLGTALITTEPFILISSIRFDLHSGYEDTVDLIDQICVEDNDRSRHVNKYITLHHFTAHDAFTINYAQ